MNEKYGKYLPIGSVVMLNSGIKRVMITGYVQIDMGAIDKVYDYSGCMYPEGVISADKTLLFNHNDIKQIYCIGYKDEEGDNFRNKLKEEVTEEKLEKMLENAKKVSNN